MKTGMQLDIPIHSKMNNKDFVFGVATSAYQIEGARNVFGRVSSIWDDFCQLPNAIKDASTGNQACNSFHLWREDLELVSYLGVGAYRLSIAWPRIIKDVSGEVNLDGLQYYKKIIDYLNTRSINVFVTLYHWDLPNFLQQRGGWQNQKTALAFAHYADVVSQYFGDDIGHYTTLNEPWCSAFLGHDLGIHAPGIKDRRSAYKASHYLLLAHGLAVRKIRKNTTTAKIGIALNLAPHFAVSESSADHEATQIAECEMNDMFLQPLLCGQYPDWPSPEQEEMLPSGYHQDLETISQRVDFIGINYYTRNLIQAASEFYPRPFEISTKFEGDRTAMGWEIYPQGLTQLLIKLDRKYNLPPIFILENGIALDDKIEQGQINDEKRIRFIQDHLMALDYCLEQSIDIRGYFIWSLLDNFEWSEGISKRFGLFFVDYSNMKRYPKKSAHALSQCMTARRQRIENCTTNKAAIFRPK